MVRAWAFSLAAGSAFRFMHGTAGRDAQCTAQAVNRVVGELVIANEKLLGRGPDIFLNSAVAVVAYKPLAHVQGIKMKVLVLHVLYTDDNDRPSTAPSRPAARPTMYTTRDGAGLRTAVLVGGPFPCCGQSGKRVTTKFK